MGCSRFDGGGAPTSGRRIEMACRACWRSLFDLAFLGLLEGSFHYIQCQ